MSLRRLNNLFVGLLIARPWLKAFPTLLVFAAVGWAVWISWRHSREKPEEVRVVSMAEAVELGRKRAAEQREMRRAAQVRELRESLELARKGERLRRDEILDKIGGEGGMLAAGSAQWLDALLAEPGIWPEAVDRLSRVDRFQSEVLAPHQVRRLLELFQDPNAPFAGRWLALAMFRLAGAPPELRSWAHRLPAVSPDPVRGRWEATQLFDAFETSVIVEGRRRTGGGERLIRPWRVPVAPLVFTASTPKVLFGVFDSPKGWIVRAVGPEVYHCEVCVSTKPAEPMTCHDAGRRTGPEFVGLGLGVRRDWEPFWIPKHAPVAFAKIDCEDLEVPFTSFIAADTPGVEWRYGIEPFGTLAPASFPRDPRRFEHAMRSAGERLLREARATSFKQALDREVERLRRGEGGALAKPAPGSHN